MFVRDGDFTNDRGGTQFQERASSAEIVEILRVAAGSAKVYICRARTKHERVWWSPVAVYLCNKLRRTPALFRPRATLTTRRR